MPRERAIGIGERRAGADAEHAVASRIVLELVDAADVDDLREVAQLLRHPEADIGVAGEDRRLRMAARSSVSSATVRGAKKRRPACS